MTIGRLVSVCGRDRRQDERVDARLHDRAAGREVVGGRAGRRRDDQAVGLHARHELVADGHRQIDHPRAGRLGDDGVVQRDQFREGLARPEPCVERSIIRFSMCARPSSAASSEG